MLTDGSRRLSVKSRSVLHLRTNSESSETSDILYSLSCSSSDLSSYLPCSDSVHPCFPFCPTLSYYHAIVNYVDSTSCPYDRSSPRTPVPVPAPPLDSKLLLYLNPLYLSIQPNLIISLLCLLAFFPYVYSPPTNSLLSDLQSTPASDLRPEIIGHTADRTSGPNT